MRVRSRFIWALMGLCVSAPKAECAGPGFPVHLDAEPTVLHVERDGQLRQVLAVNVSPEGDGWAGGDPVPRSDITAGGHTCIMGKRAFGDDTMVAGWQVHCVAPGSIKLKIYRRRGDSMVMAAESPLEHMNPGLNRFGLPHSIPVKKDDMVGFYVGPGASVAEDPRGGDFYFRNGDVTDAQSDAGSWGRSQAISSVQAYDENSMSALEKFNESLPRATVTIRQADETRSVAWAQLASDGSTRFLDVAGVGAPTSATITLAGDQLEASRTVTLKPERKWKVYLFHSVHVDIGYTNPQEVVARRLVRNLEQLMDFDAADYTGPTGRKPAWNCEAAWVIDAFRRRRPTEQFERLMSYFSRDRLSAQALYCNTLSGLCDSEELVRLLYFTAGLKRDYGIPVLSAMQTDTPNYTYALPSVLAGAGIRYLSVGQNRQVAGRRPGVSPFYWVGPDGSEVLVWHSQGYYRSGGMGSSWRALQDRLRAAERESETCDAFGSHGLYGDNAAINIDNYKRQLDLVKAWNQRWAYPRIIVGTPYDMLHYVEERFGPTLPRIRGDWGCDWEDGAASSARETGINRVAKKILVAAETLATITSAVTADYRYPREAIDGAFRSAILYDEHTWGAGESISAPESETTKRQWAVKSACATSALEDARSVLDSALAGLAAEIPTNESYCVVVYNPLSWTRTGIAEVELPPSWPDDWAGHTRDNVTDVANLSQREGRKIVFVADDVPPVGYKTFQIARGGGPDVAPATFTDLAIENRFFKITIDPHTGAVASIFDKELRRELVDRASPYHFNQYVYDRKGVKGMQYRRRGKVEPDVSNKPPRPVWTRPGRVGPVRSSLIVVSSGPMAPRIEQEIFLYHPYHSDLKRIDFVNRLQKEPTHEVEQVYYAFPFAVERPDFTCELGGSIISALRDRFACADRNWFAIQNWVDVSNERYGITWASREAPLVSFVHMYDGWIKKVVPTNATLFSYAMNNVWVTNYKAGQGGDFTFRYAMTSHPDAGDRLAATRFGAAAANPLMCKLIPPGQKGSLPADQCSFCQIDGEGVVLQCLKRSEDGRGIIVRVREVRGRDTRVRIGLPQFAFRHAAKTNLVEEDQEVLGPKDHAVVVAVKGNGMATVRCW